MKINSLIFERNQLIPVEVELTLWPGLPGIQFLGLPDQHLKESVLRIKSAIKAQGFEFPKAQQVLVNLRPSFVKKSSRGLELAVASALLWETEQLPAPISDSQFYVYGELGLKGEVYEPDDLVKFQAEKSISVLTGASLENQKRQFRRKIVKKLSDIANPEEKPAEMEKVKIIRPPLASLFVSQEQADLLKLVAVGEYSILLAGPAGTGKSTFANILYSLLDNPTDEKYLEIQKNSEKFNRKVEFRPLVKPHHTIPVMAMIGGGSVPLAGEISRAHGGLMILDELLEFKSQVIEALREPLEEGVINVARLGKYECFPADFITVATTNLCPCGDKAPNPQEKIKSCRYTIKKCNSYMDKLSGPFIDRFDLIYFSKSTQNFSVSVSDVFQQIQEVRKFQQKSRQQTKMNKRLSLAELMHRACESVGFYMNKEEAVSYRRKLATLRVARGLADLEFAEKVELKHLNLAIEKCIEPFAKLKSNFY